MGFLGAIWEMSRSFDKFAAARDKSCDNIRGIEVIYGPPEW
jgi:hypothetical protein